jgi:hypothetical protein
MALRSPWLFVLIFLSLLISLPTSNAGQLITYTNSDNEVVHLDDDREPALYTQTFGSCMPISEAAITIERFDAALYMDNMTVVFHIVGNTQLSSGSVMRTSSRALIFGS